MKRTDIALELFGNSHNCAQSVFAACADESRIDVDTAKAVAAGFGGGIAGSQGVCGAVSGAIMAIGIQKYDPQNVAESKRQVSDLSKKFLQEYESREGSIACRILLGVEMSTPEGKAEIQKSNLFRTKCVRFVAAACELYEEIV